MLIFFGIWIVYAIALSLALARTGFNSSPVSIGNATPIPPKSILIIGATGRTGRHLVSQALERGYSVCAMARDPSQITLQHPKLQVMRGDVLDADSISAAIQGQDAVLCALGHTHFFGPSTILSKGTQNILEAMSTNKIKRFICETSNGIGDSVGRCGLLYSLFVIPLVLPFYFWDKAKQERLIASSESNWTIVRPVSLTDGKKRNQIRVEKRLVTYFMHAQIPRADVAQFMIDQLESNQYLFSAPTIS